MVSLPLVGVYCQKITKPFLFDYNTMLVSPIIGDIARYPYHLTGENVRIEHWNVAQNQGRLAAKNIVALASGGEAEHKFEQGSLLILAFEKL
jgi:hypothetical protein